MNKEQQDKILIRLLVIAKMGQRISQETIQALNKRTPLFTYNGTSIQHAALEPWDALLLAVGGQIPSDLMPTQNEIELLRPRIFPPVF